MPVQDRPDVETIYEDLRKLTLEYARMMGYIHYLEDRVELTED